MEESGKNRVNVIIDGKEYTIAGTEPGEYIHCIAKKVDETIAAASAASGSVNFSMRMILTALNLADEAEKKNLRIAELEKLLSIADEKNNILQKTINDLRGEIKVRSNVVKIEIPKKPPEDEDE
ncbi:MAG: cell division protein ZapA [Bacillota bacterium]|nr:cell division protein ZapA [Bacillota bacterium]